MLVIKTKLFVVLPEKKRRIKVNLFHFDQNTKVVPALSLQ